MAHPHHPQTWTQPRTTTSTSSITPHTSQRQDHTPHTTEHTTHNTQLQSESAKAGDICGVQGGVGEGAESAAAAGAGAECGGKRRKRPCHGTELCWSKSVERSLAAQGGESEQGVRRWGMEGEGGER
eukprot:1982918-Rhodomonas_salina.1